MKALGASIQVAEYIRSLDELNKIIIAWVGHTAV
jgi:hypothetical protein